MLSLNKGSCLLGAIAVAACASASSASITYISQERSVSVVATVNSAMQGSGFIAPDFGTFNRTYNENFIENTGNGLASQNSQLLPDRITMTGAARVTITSTSQRVLSIAYSRLDVVFSLDAPSTFQVVQAHTSTGGANPRLAAARLSGEAGDVFSWSEDNGVPNTWPTGSFGGLLQPGQYTLHIDLTPQRFSFPPFGPGTSEVTSSFVLIIPSPSAAVTCILMAAACACRRQRTS